MLSSETWSRFVTSTTGDPHKFRDLLRRRSSLQLRAQIGLCLADPVEQIRLLLRESERTALIGQRVDDGLPNPPDRIGDELHVLARIETLGRLNQADVPFVDEVEERESAAAIAFRVGHDEAKIRLDEPVQRFRVSSLYLRPKDIRLIRI